MMESYDNFGLSDSKVKDILKCEMTQEETTNLEGLVLSYHNLEKALFGLNVEVGEDDLDEYGDIDVEEENLATL